MRKFLAIQLVIALSMITAIPANALNVPKSFEEFAKSSALADPGILVIDPISQTEIFESSADIPRAPASILKLISSVTAIRAFGQDRTFKTSISTTSDPQRFILLGEYDPWLTTSPSSAKKFQRALSTKLINAISSTGADPKAVTIEFNGLFTKDIENLQTFYGKNLNFKRTTKADVKKVSGLTPLAEVSSPPLNEIIGFTLLWSDNTLADRLARNAADELGFTRDSDGMNLAFQETLQQLGVYSKGLDVKDGSGLSHDDRVSARTIAELLWKIRNEPEFYPVYAGLPVAGESGTLKDRFKKSGKAAAGLVKAKTGWINTSVTLAGYVEVGDNEYVFAVIANKVTPTEKSRDLARKTIDKMLATVAKPAEVELEGQ